MTYGKRDTLPVFLLVERQLGFIPLHKAQAAQPVPLDQGQEGSRLLLLLQCVFLDLIHKKTISCCGPVSAISIPVYILISL